MKRIILSLLTLGIVGVLATSATTALLSDEEVSTGNTFTAGSIDLLIDNESYYNGVARDDLSWLQSNLDDGQGPGEQGVYLFFNYDDLKPGDWGEDTISIHVDNNESWLCADVTLTSNNDNECTEPEGDEDFTCGDPGEGEGELADAITFYWWADDGDNVYEEGETLLQGGPLGALDVDETVAVPLADANVNIWDGNGPFPGDSTRFIGKAWCFGETNFLPYAPGDSSPVERPVLCDGAPLNNETQTDSFTADIVFRAVQSRNNPNFICEVPGRTTLTVIKQVINDDQTGDSEVGDFSLSVSPDVGSVTSGELNVIEPGSYNVSEAGPGGYDLTYDGDCDSNGDITIEEGEQLTCILINDDTPPVTVDLTVTKIVDGGPLQVADFDLFVDVTQVNSDETNQFAPGAHVVSEVDDSGLYTTTIGGDDCDGSGNVTLVENNPASCTITNTYDPATLNVDKRLDVTTPGIDAGDFELHITGPNGDQIVSDNVPTTDLPAGDYAVSEILINDAIGVSFETTFDGACNASGEVTLAQGDDLECTILNREL